MRMPSRQHEQVGSLAGGRTGGRRETSPPLRAIRIRKQHREDWGQNPYPVRDRSISPRSREHLCQLSPDLVRRKREYGSASSFQSNARHHLMDGVDGARGGLDWDHHPQEHILDRHPDLQQHIRMREFRHISNGDFVSVSSASGLVGEELRALRPPRLPQDGFTGKEIMVPRSPRPPGDGRGPDGRGGNDIFVFKNSRIFEDDLARKDAIVPRPVRYLEDGPSGGDVGVLTPAYLEDGPAHSHFGQSMSHRPGIHSLGSGSVAESSSRIRLHGDEQNLWSHRRIGDGYGGEMDNLYSGDGSYTGLFPSTARAMSGLPTGLPEDGGDTLHLSQGSHHLLATKDTYSFSNTGNLSDMLFINGYSPPRHAIKREGVSRLDRDCVQNKGYSDSANRESNSTFLSASDITHGHFAWETEDEKRNTLIPSYFIPPRSRFDIMETSRTTKRPHIIDHCSSFENNQLSVRQHGFEFPDDFPLVREHVEKGSRVIKGNEPSYIETEHDYEGVADLRESCKVRSRRSLMDNQFEDTYQENGSHLQRIIHKQTMDAGDLQGERVPRRRYIADVVDEDGHTNFYSMAHTQHGRELDRNFDQCTSEDRPFKANRRYEGGRPQHNVFSRRASGSSSQALNHSSSRFFDVRSVNFERRSKQEPAKFLDNFRFKKRQFPRSYHRYWKKSEDSFHDLSDTNEGDFKEGDMHTKKDPSEDSEEFKLQVHKAFLRFSKVLNEDPQQKKRYKEQWKGGSLFCCVCGSISREFVDTHSLAMHSFNSLKVGMRTDHLGLHKALCVLMGWNWKVAPDGAKHYHFSLSSEASAMKEDLILWPPLVIININYDMYKKNAGSQLRIMTKEELEGILKGIGVGVGKARVVMGKAENNNIAFVKFLGTFSGLQEAEQLHKYYLDNGRGRKEFRTLDAGGSGCAEAVVTDDNAAHLLYGYLAIAEDLDKLDTDTKRRCVVRSKRDIEAIADAPLTSEVTPVGS